MEQVRKCPKRDITNGIRAPILPSCEENLKRTLGIHGKENIELAVVSYESEGGVTTKSNLKAVVIPNFVAITNLNYMKEGSWKVYWA